MSTHPWCLDPDIIMLNHGSFGACPRPVLDLQDRLRARMEERPVPFLVREMQPLLDESRQALAALIGGDASNLAFVTNATAGVNAVLRSLRFQPGDELLVTDHGYNACSNVVRYVAQRERLRVAVARIPLPIESSDQVVQAVLDATTPQTRLVLIDHITSPTAVIFPVAEIIRRLAERDIDTLIDGAHAPGMLPLELDRLGAAYYTGNCHKWLCAPKGAAFLYVRPDRQEGLQPPVISHGYNQPRRGYSPFQDAFDWQGTYDPTPWLCVSESIRFVSGLFAGGLEGLMRRNRELALTARRILSSQTPLQPICPSEMLGAMVAFRLPDSVAATAPADPEALVPLPALGRVLANRYSIETPVHYWPAPPRTLLRVSAQAYNNAEHYERLANALAELL